jgi:DNA-binding Lrp family transcriptional regulator
MEQALILGTQTFAFPIKMLKELRSVPGVTSANFIFGPYDFYVRVETETKEELGEVVIRIREIEGVRTTMTCSIVVVPSEALS